MSLILNLITNQNIFYGFFQTRFEFSKIFQLDPSTNLPSADDFFGHNFFKKN